MGAQAEREGEQVQVAPGAVSSLCNKGFFSSENNQSLEQPGGLEVTGQGAR